MKRASGQPQSRASAADAAGTFLAVASRSVVATKSWTKNEQSDWAPRYGARKPALCEGSNVALSLSHAVRSDRACRVPPRGLSGDCYRFVTGWHRTGVRGLLWLGMDVVTLTPQEVGSLEGAALLNACRELALAANRLEALQTRVAAQIWSQSEGAGGPDSLAKQHGCRNSVGLIQRLTGASARTVSARVRLGRQTRSELSMLGEQLAPRQEHLATALDSGAMCAESANHISRMLVRARRPGNAEDLDMAERCLAQAATGHDFQTGDSPGMALHADDVRLLCLKWEEALDPDGAEPDQELRMKQRFLTIGPVRNGLSRMNGLVTAEVAASLGAVCDAMSNPRARSSELAIDGPITDDITDDPITDGSVAGSSSTGDLAADSPATGAGGGGDIADERTPAQKRHDALATALGVALASRQLPVLQGAPATVVVEIQEETLRGQGGIAWLTDHEGSHAPIPLDSVRHISCGAKIQAVVRDSIGRVTKLGTPARIFNASQRRAIALRDGGCVIPGCTVPAAWCEVHHVQPHSEGGATHTDNGVLLCHYHHHSIDTSGWRISMRAGVPFVQPPAWLQDLFPGDPRESWVNSVTADQNRKLRDKLRRSRKLGERLPGRDLERAPGKPEPKRPKSRPPAAALHSAETQRPVLRDPVPPDSVSRDSVPPDVVLPDSVPPDVVLPDSVPRNPVSPALQRHASRQGQVRKDRTREHRPGPRRPVQRAA